MTEKILSNLPFLTHELPDHYKAIMEYLAANQDKVWAQDALRRIKLAKRLVKFVKAARKAAPMLWAQCEHIRA